MKNTYKVPRMFCTEKVFLTSDTKKKNEIKRIEKVNQSLTSFHLET